MKGLRNAIWTAAIILSTAAPALAQTGRKDNSGIFVYVFLGFCALIVVAQAVPAILLMIGMGRAAVKRAKKGEKTPVEVKVEAK